MQVNKIPNNFQHLRQGTVVSIVDLKFSNESKYSRKKEISFKDMYPEVNLTGVTYGIILTQTCDLVLNKEREISAPYINFVLAEPIDRYIDDEYNEKLNKIYEKYSLQFAPDDKRNYTLRDRESILDLVTKDFARLFQNNDKYLYFLVLPWGIKSRMYILNLTKVFPFRRQHNKVFLKKSKYQLKPFFENKLGWKIANLYGRVATPDYKKTDLKELTRNLLKRIEDKNKYERNAIEIKDDDFKEAKNLRNASLKKRSEFFTELMNRV